MVHAWLGHHVHLMSVQLGKHACLATLHFVEPLHPVMDSTILLSKLAAGLLTGRSYCLSDS